MQSLGNHDRVVERRLREPTPIVCLQRLARRSLELITGPAEQRGAHLCQFLAAQRLRVGRIKAPRELRIENVQRALIAPARRRATRIQSEEHTSELQSRLHLVCRLLLEKKKKEAQNI